jgi:hypothetical protein
MKRMMILSVVAIAALVACKPDPAKAVKIVDKGVGTPAPQAALPPWQDSNCNLAPEPAGGKSTFVAKGPCSFTHTGTAKCRSLTDDSYALFLRNASGEATVAVYINTEQYKGAGNYTNAQITMTYQNGTNFYYWSSDSVHVTIPQGEGSVILPENKLEAEPPNSGTEVISGTLVCDKTKGATIIDVPRK